MNDATTYPRATPVDTADRLEGISIQLSDVEEPFCITWEDAEQLAASLLLWVEPTGGRKDPS